MTVGFGTMSAAKADENVAPTSLAVCPQCQRTGIHRHDAPAVGTLGYGPPGLYAGFQGFSLGYHLGYGYGGDALGVGAYGGYPFYGGPGYPHPGPTLRRFGSIMPFAYFGGPGFPTPECRNYFGTVGPLATNPPVVKVERTPDEADPNSGYGCFTGALPYPEEAFAPFATRAALVGTDSQAATHSSRRARANAEEQANSADIADSLGFTTEPVAVSKSPPGLKLTAVRPGRRRGESRTSRRRRYRAVNGYVTKQPAHLRWILSNAVTENALKMTVTSEPDGEPQKVTLLLPLGKDPLSRPSP